MLDNFSLKFPAGKVTALVVSLHVISIYMEDADDSLLKSIWFWKEHRRWPY